jgi:hypothetical protein
VELGAENTGEKGKMQKTKIAEILAFFLMMNKFIFQGRRREGKQSYKKGRIGCLWQPQCL